MKVYKPTDPLHDGESQSLFLAGSIEMGSAIDWQKQVEDSFSSYDIAIYNPRRDDWDSSWTQSIENEQFYHQVTWELQHQERASAILLYFAPDTKSPISLLELGLFGTQISNAGVAAFGIREEISGNDRLHVVCPDEFWRQGNVEIVCRRYGIPYFKELAPAINEIKRKFIESKL